MLELQKSFFQEPLKKRFTILFIASSTAIIIPCIVFLYGHYSASHLGSWKFYALFAPLGFCSGLSFYDDNYTGLRLIGTIIGAMTGILMMGLIPNLSLYYRFLFSLFVTPLFASVGYMIVGYDGLISWRWHW